MLSHVSLSLQFVAINHAYRCDGIPSDIAILMKSYRFPPVCCQMFSKFSKKNGSILLPCSLLRSTLPTWWQPQWQPTYSCLSSIGCVLSASISESWWWWWGGKWWWQWTFPYIQILRWYCRFILAPCSYLELRFGRLTRLLASMAFSLQMVLYMGCPS